MFTKALTTKHRVFEGPVTRALVQQGQRRAGKHTPPKDSAYTFSAIVLSRRVLREEAPNRALTYIDPPAKRGFG